MNTIAKDDERPSLEMRRVLPFARERVFDAWVSEKHLHRWLGPAPDIEARYVEVDLREGGAYRFGFVEEGEPVKYVHGVYHTIRAPEKLVFSWVWEAPQIDAGTTTLVTVVFNEIDNGTEVLLKHERFAGTESCELHAWGWRGTFDKLNTYLPEVERQRRMTDTRAD